MKTNINEDIKYFAEKLVKAKNLKAKKTILRQLEVLIDSQIKRKKWS